MLRKSNESFFAHGTFRRLLRFRARSFRPALCRALRPNSLPAGQAGLQTFAKKFLIVRLKNLPLLLRHSID